jgi:ABC-2 type transport system permease protein
MIRVLSSEMLRFRSRGMVKILTLLAIIGIVIGAVLATLASKQPSDAQLAQAQQQRDRQVVRCVRRDGFHDTFGPRSADQTVQAYCEEHIRPEDFVYTEQLRIIELADYVKAAGVIVIVIGLVIGASMVGASWQTGTITTILTWEPRRIRWLASRVIVTAVGVFVVALVLLALLAAALALGASLRGSTSTEPGWTNELLGAMVRVAAVAAAVAVVGAAVATIGRNTAAALGAVFVYLAVLESFVRGFRPLLSRFMLGDSAAIIVSGESRELFDREVSIIVTTGHALTVIAVYLAVLVAVACVMLRARDVN